MTYILAVRKKEAKTNDVSRRQGLFMFKKRQKRRQAWSPSEVQYLRRSYDRLSLKEIAEVLHKPVHRVSIAASALGLARKDESKTSKDIR